MTYVVLARKWRPQSFDELTGQEHVARTLQNAILSGRIPHAILLTGPRGVGKTSSARILSMALNCESGPTPEPCGTCQACNEVRSGRSVDILEIDGASNRGINEIRELRDSVQYAPSRDRYKIYIIDEVHMLTTEAFNALLKTLEEPPPHVVFIFATTEPQKIPVTILSRCQRFDFRQIALDALVGRLDFILQAEKIAAEPEALHMIARQAAGGMRDALSLLDQVISSSDGKITVEKTAELLGAADRRLLFALSKAILSRETATALETLQLALRRGTDVSWFANEFAAHLRDLTVLWFTQGNSELAIMSDAELSEARAQLELADGPGLEAALDIMISAAEEIARSSMGEMRFELALIRMCEIASQRSIDYLIALLEKHAGISTELPEAPPTTRRTSGAGGGNTGEGGTGGGIPATDGNQDGRSTAADGNQDGRSTADAASTTNLKAVGSEPPKASFTVASPNLERQPSTPPAEELSATEFPTEELPAEFEPNAERPTFELSAEEDSTPEPNAHPAFDADNASNEYEDEEPALLENSAPHRPQEPTFQSWRKAVEALGDHFAMPRRTLAMGYCEPNDGVFRVWVSSAYVHQDREAVQKAFNEISTELFGRPWTLELIEDTSLTEDERSQLWRIRSEEDEEREALRQSIHTRIQMDPRIQILQERWPDFEVRREHITFNLESNSNQEPEEVEL